MPLPINRKIFIYLFIFFSLGTYSNKEFLNVNFFEINGVEIIGLNELEINQIDLSFNDLKNNNLFFLKKSNVSEKISSQKVVEKFFVFKKYPSKLNIRIEKTNLLAIIKKNGVDFYLGSNGKLIQTKNNKIYLPLLSENTDIKEFLKLKKIIDDSNFDFKNIKNFYYFKSKRWNIKTKDDLVIKLPVKRLETSFKILSKILKNREFNNIKTIDLRQNNLVILNG